MDNAAREELDRLTAYHPRARAAWRRLAAATLLRAAWADEFGTGTGAGR